MTYESRTTAYRGSSRIDNTLGEDTTVTSVTPSVSIGLGYGATVALAVPLVHTDYQILRHQDRDGEPLPRYDETQFGVGDVSLYGQWTLAEPKTASYAWFGLGLSIPTAEERDYPALSGMDFGEVLTLGSGTWDPLILHGFGFAAGGLQWNGSIFLRWTPYENRFGYQVGSVVQSWLGFGRDLGEAAVSGHLRVGYRHQWRARRDGVDVLNSGGDWVSLAPELRWKIKPDLEVKLGVELPVWRDLYAAPDGVDQIVNGQTDTEQRWMLGFAYEVGE